MSKRKIRDLMLARRDAQPERQIEILSRAAQKAIIVGKLFRGAGTVGAYFALGSEVRTDLIISESRRLGKILALPKVEQDRISFYEVQDRKNLVRGRFGVMEPPPSRKRVKSIDLLVVPGVAFDRRGFRLGYGMGYYDRFLYENHITSVGLAYSLQILEKIPHGKRDMRMDAIASEKGVITSGE